VYDAEFDDSEYDVNPSTTAGWRWKAVELMTAPSAKHAIALVTPKADIWAFAMTVCEVGFLFSTSSVQSMC
jgi:hypothetical protein